MIDKATQTTNAEIYEVDRCFKTELNLNRPKMINISETKTATKNKPLY